MFAPDALFVLIAASVPCVTGHYVFSRFLFNNTMTEQWEYYMPFYDIYSPDVRCGRGASTSGPGSKTATVLAGDEVGFVIGRSADEPMEPYIIYHNGPGQAYLSRSNSYDLSSYEGDGEWFKIASLGAKNDTWWLTRDQTGMNFTIPPTTPPGKYLLRVEHLYVRPAFNTTQFYIACAQIEVLGNDGGGARMPGPEFMAKFPGAYDFSDPGILVEERVYDWPSSGLLEYKAPGPPVWTG
ncbi:fungal cellulose binding domain-containing protein [Apodospora peruviana]|uniref:lytic cellulose monooxygenase (C4-dehydrogenating) n=1 Tax=Apodospora peruviana TaxID=516989 RepID=A0AAE0LYL6_9PEZI|nr:fungal cellulose binding domain-containing protein [Apodospora peruviana]